MIEEDKKNTKSIKEIIAKYKNKNFITAETAIISQHEFTSKNFFGIKPKKPIDDGRSIKSSIKFDREEKMENNLGLTEGLSDNSSFNIKNENFVPGKMLPVNDNTLNKSNKISHADANVNQINLDTSNNSFEMLHMVKKAINNNSNYNEVQTKQSNVKTIPTAMNNYNVAKPAEIMSHMESPYNQSHDYNGLKAPVITANNYYLNSPYKTESVNVSFVKNIEDKIATLKQKIIAKTHFKVNFDKVKKMKFKQWSKIFQFMNFELGGFYFSCKYMQNEILNHFKEGGKLISQNFQKQYLNILTINLKKIVVTVNSKKGMKKTLKIDLVIQAKIISNKLTDKTICLCSLNKYNMNNEAYKNIYKFDVKKPGPLSIWIMREYTNFHQDDLNKAYFQPIISFTEGDNIDLNVNVLSERGIVDFSSFQWKKAYIDKTPDLNFLEFKENHKYREIFDFDLTRFCEIEILKNKWSDISNHENSAGVMEKVKSLFEPYFFIQKVLFEDVGYMMFKIFLVSATPGKVYFDTGEIPYNPEIGITIKIMNFCENIVNEVKKNCLIYDRLNEVNVRVGDIVVFYYSRNKEK